MYFLCKAPVLASGARSWIPAGLIILFSEMGARDERLVQVRRIIDDAGNHEPAFAIRFVSAVVKLCHHSLIAIRYAVPAKIPRPHFGRDNLEGAGKCRVWAAGSRDD